eukprot:CAMPEP_0205900032 /NCGR_PEP_ID=MMETSP1083-20121108/26933_1 /ASSEMBLY_ACC=CAM_ASM_000430 /TAXON_ID=97485 /ORGANISM="Prymnesium parvum, Strain Texoma1" /LENGTH=129 /DNA_ID=CAMNT_0053265469 /DNA_START=158 /DNA_END=547 /DNA_ORIENTATION=-
MLVLDDDDDMLEAEERDRSYAANDEPMEAEADGEADTPEDEQFSFLPLVLQMIEAHGAQGDSGRLDAAMNAFRARLARSETFLADIEQKALSEAPQDEAQLTELLAVRTELLRDHMSRRLPKSKTEGTS